MRLNNIFNPDLLLQKAEKGGLQIYHFLEASINTDVPEKALYKIAQRFCISDFELKQLIADYRKGGYNNG